MVWSTLFSILDICFIPSPTTYLGQSVIKVIFSLSNTITLNSYNTPSIVRFSVLLSQEGPNSSCYTFYQLYYLE